MQVEFQVNGDMVKEVTLPSLSPYHVQMAHHLYYFSVQGVNVNNILEGAKATGTYPNFLI